MKTFVRAMALGALALCLSAPAFAQTAAGKLMRVTGPLTVNGKPVQAGAILKEGDRIETGPSTRADVTLADGSAVLLYEKSTLTLAKSGKQVRLVLARGSALNAVHKGSNYQMSSPSAIAAVRGTVFFLSSDGTPNKGYVCVCEGRVAVSDATTHVGETYTTTHHTGFDVGGGQILPAGMVGHTDADGAEVLKLRR